MDVIMAIELYWDNDERNVMLIEAVSPWTWDDLYDVLGKIKKVTDTAPYEIGAILDVSRGATIPGGSLFTQSSLDHARQLLRMGENGTGPVVIVGANSFIRTVYSTFYPMDRKALGNVKFAASQDEARDLLRGTLQPSHMPKTSAIRGTA
jgi:hypothetical protein